MLQYVNEFRNEVNLQKKEGKIINKHYETPNANLFNKKTLTTIEINEIIFTGQLIEIDASQSLSFKLVDQVWLLMKSIFEERVITFSESGLIVERKSK